MAVTNLNHLTGLSPTLSKNLLSEARQWWTDHVSRHGKHRPPRRRLRLRWLALAALLVLSPAVYSYTRTMLQPSSLPLGVRSVEWLRAHHGNWVVDEAE